MGIIRETYLKPDGYLAFWKIDEDFDALYNMVSLTREEEDLLYGFKSPKRQLEWLSVRLLVRHMTGKPNRIVYNGQRKPFLEDRSHHISISHSDDLTAVFLSKTHRVGLDLEKQSHKVQRIAHKFINDQEYIDGTDVEIEDYHLYIHWCIKEAIYKICDKQDINFKENIFVEHFTPESAGSVKARLDNIHGLTDFDVHYEKLGQHVIAWCLQ